jgi:hypothetical protein
MTPSQACPLRWWSRDPVLKPKHLTGCFITGRLEAAPPATTAQSDEKRLRVFKTINSDQFSEI